ncbi:hypothetical protein NLI96_g4299 [Meripilus lineatus]|uniref:Cytochrome P450 n=1 Tax=Meripilus lineatus TaxID=2056292 RepID=A0AAD5VAG4_9APHY|nr:hypothetical protein NLI96_g4299 [Physisporinus lineatus]
MFSLIREAHLPVSDEAGILLGFMWGMHSNTINTTHWLFLYLLSDQPSFLRIRDEIDSKMGTMFGGDIRTFLASSASTLRSGDFPLLDSAIKETLRLTIQATTFREAHKDTEIVYGDGKRAFIQKGSWVAPNVGSVQNGGRPEDELSRFRLERYLPNQKDGNASQQPPFLAFGGGAHMCKGRLLALHQLKVFLILCVTLFDMTLLDESGHDFVELPSPDPTNPGVVRPSKQLLCGKGRSYVKVFLILWVTLFDMILLDKSGKDFVGDIPSSDPSTPGLARPVRQLLVRIERRQDGRDVDKGFGNGASV